MKFSNPHFQHWFWWINVTILFFKVVTSFGKGFYSQIIILIIKIEAADFFQGGVYQTLNDAACSKFNINQLTDGWCRKRYCLSNWNAGNSKSNRQLIQPYTLVWSWRRSSPFVFLHPRFQLIYNSYKTDLANWNHIVRIRENYHQITVVCNNQLLRTFK